MHPGHGDSTTIAAEAPALPDGSPAVLRPASRTRAEGAHPSAVSSVIMASVAAGVVKPGPSRGRRAGRRLLTRSR